MGEVLKAWFRDRLGIMIDLSPDEFGLITKDGTLLAQLLHSYDIIDNAQLNTIIGTEDPALARVNLRLLRLWLRFIGVDCDDDTIEDVSNGKGTTAIRLFYKIFISLESKDKLHFITQQKEREKYIPNSFKFDVTTVAEEQSTPAEPSENPLAKRLIKNASVVAWHRDKFEGILDRCKSARKQCLAKLQARNPAFENEKLAPRIVEEDRLVRGDRRSRFAENESKELRDFSEKTGDSSRVHEYTYRDLCAEKKLGESMKPTSADQEAAKRFVKRVEYRGKRASVVSGWKNRAEKSLTRKLLDREMSEREKSFDSAIGDKLFAQSQYEKQMIAKLCEIRDQKRRLAYDRGIVDELMREKTEAEHSMELARERETVAKEATDFEAECLRICELHRRMNERKIRNFEKKRDRVCAEVLNDLIDISLKAADYREANDDDDDCIPPKIWAEWKALFVKNQPIFERTEDRSPATIPGSEFRETEEENSRLEKERQEVLNESDLDNYLHLRSPWEEFAPDIDTETEEILVLGGIVLGYIVNRVLQRAYSSKQSEKPTEKMPKLSTACILLGLSDASVYPTMQTLLNNRGIRMVRVDEGINHCLECYKEETTVDPEVATSNSGAKTGVNDDEDERSSKAAESTTRISKARQVIDEQTQTPRSFPTDSTSSGLSSAAHLGKLIAELFAAGEPIPDELTGKIIIEHVKSLTGIRGWVLIDYPNTYNQMALLESELTGAMIPLEETDSRDDIDDDDDDDDEKPKRKPRISIVSQHGSALRESRLVSNPIVKGVGDKYDSYMTAYIRALPKPRDMHDSTDEISEGREVLPEDATAMDQFYADRGLAYAVYYASLDPFTLKKLCRLFVNGQGSSLPRIPSVELFGDGLETLNDQTGEPTPSKIPVIKRLVLKDPTPSDRGDSKCEYEDEDAANDERTRPPKPGEEYWQWLNLPQSEIVLDMLSTVWTSMETVYTEKLKEIFGTKRINYSHVLPYRNNVAKHMREFIGRPDAAKQNILHDFQTLYNEIEPEMRDDLDAKCELHCRVADLREALWQICDERRRESEDERRRIISEDWTADEMTVMTNLYISLFDVEINRCVDTVQFLEDYYTSMLQRPISDFRVPKLPLHKLKSDPTESKRPGTRDASEIGKNAKEKIPPIIDCSEARKQIAEMMIGEEIEPSDPDETIFIEAISANYSYAENILDRLSSRVSEILRKVGPSSSTRGNVGRLPVSNNAKASAGTTTIIDTQTSETARRSLDLFDEWKSAVKYELTRARLVLKTLETAARSELNFVLDTVKRCFANASKETNDRYDGEVRSVDRMTSLFRLAIEESLPIREELSLDGDRFLVKSKVLMYPEESRPLSEAPTETVKPSEFRIGQLGRLMDIFRYVGPHGSVPERVFVYIIEDIIALRESETGMIALPKSWYELEAYAVPEIARDIFGESEYIDWREFIVHCMDLPMPNEDEILEARSRFVALDTNMTETVTRYEFHRTELWFGSPVSRDANECRFGIDDILHEDHEGKSETERVDYRGDKMMNSTKSNRSSSSIEGYSNGVCYAASSVCSVKMSGNSTPKSTVRLMLAKELLCEMFVTGCDQRVNYTAFLLAFCRGYDPRDGLGKALTLANGKKVCTSVDKGEMYVERFFEKSSDERYGNDVMINGVEEVLSEFYASRNSELNIGTSSDLGLLEKEKLRGNCFGKIESHERSFQSDNFQSEISIPIPLYGNAEFSFNVIKPAEHEPSKNISSTIIPNDLLSRENKSHRSLIAASDSDIAYWIPRQICLTVLVASLPWHSRQPDIVGTTSCLRECLEKVYADISDVRSNDYDQNYVLSHRFVNHDFILNLINSTSAFTVKNLANILHKFTKTSTT